MPDRPLWFLDIDGVINAFPKRGRDYGFEFETDTVLALVDDETLPLPLTWRKEIIDLINDVHRTGAAEVVWLTTWGDQARTVFAPTVGLDDFTVAGNPPPSDHPTRKVWLPSWWKLGALRDHVGTSGRRFLFTDDDLGRETRKVLHGWFDKDDALLVTPASSVGLSDRDVSRIVDFLGIDRPAWLPPLLP